MDRSDPSQLIRNLARVINLMFLHRIDLRFLNDLYKPRPCGAGATCLRLEIFLFVGQPGEKFVRLIHVTRERCPSFWV